MCLTSESIWLASLAGYPLDVMPMEGLMGDERGRQDVEQRTGVDDSYPLVRRTLHASYLGLGVGSGDATPDEVASLRAAFQQALAAEGLTADDIRATVWSVGRSAAVFDSLNVDHLRVLR